MEKSNFDSVVKQSEYLVGHFHSIADEIERIINKMKDESNLNCVADIIDIVQNAMGGSHLNVLTKCVIHGFEHELHSQSSTMTNPIIDQDGNKRWYKAWYQNGQLHRENGPAIEYANGYKEWYQNGQFHRLDGPTIE